MSTIRVVCGMGWLLMSVGIVGAPMKIACIGDSITAGSGLSNPAVDGYPAKLQRLLGTNYVVRNYGVSGRTLLKKGDYPYWKETFYTNSHEWGPDVVIIQLGTNDSKPYNWRYGTNFVADYEALVASYASLTSGAQVIACTPCPVYRNGVYDIRPGTVATNIAPAVRNLAARLNLRLVDLHTRLAGHAEWFPDTVHPNSKGMTAMAAVVYETLAGGLPSEPPPGLEVHRTPTKRVVLTWPASWRGLLPQATSALRPTNTLWSVSETIIYLDGDVVRQTNSPSGAARVYRLWQP